MRSRRMAGEGGFMIAQEQKRAQGRARSEHYRARLKDGIRFQFQIPITERRISDWIASGALGPDAFVNEAAVRAHVERIICYGNAAPTPLLGGPPEPLPPIEHKLSPAERRKLSRSRRREGTRLLWVEITDYQLDEWRSWPR